MNLFFRVCNVSLEGILINSIRKFLKHIMTFSPLPLYRCTVVFVVVQLLQELFVLH